MECDFCKTKYNGPYRIDCPECGFPVHGDLQQQAQFSTANAELKAVIDEAETALSWARFALLWPWLTVLALAAWLLRSAVETGAGIDTCVNYIDHFCTCCDG